MYGIRCIYSFIINRKNIDEEIYVHADFLDAGTNCRCIDHLYRNDYLPLKHHQLRKQKASRLRSFLFFKEKRGTEALVSGQCLEIADCAGQKTFLRYTFSHGY